MLANICKPPPDHAVAPGWFEKYREILRHDPRGVAKVIRALRHLRDAAAAPDRAETERELAFFRKHRHRMRYHALKEEGIAIGSGVVEAANKTLVTQRMKRSGMRWRIVGGQAVLTFRALIKSGPLRAGMEGPDQRNRHTGQRQHQSHVQQPWQSLPELNEPSRRHHCHARLAPFSEAFFKGAIKMFQRDNEMRSIVLSDAQARDQATRHFFNRALREVREEAQG